jgi:hypothetical protein
MSEYMSLKQTLADGQAAITADFHTQPVSESTKLKFQNT